MSRNICKQFIRYINIVTSREGRVSRNIQKVVTGRSSEVTSREGRVSRNDNKEWIIGNLIGHVPRGTCE